MDLDQLDKEINFALNQIEEQKHEDQPELKESEEKVVYTQTTQKTLPFVNMISNPQDPSHAP